MNKIGELDSESYSVLREAATEAPFSHPYYYYSKDEGIYLCKACGEELFHSSAKYESGSGWPSFYQPKDPQVTTQENDDSLFMGRVEVKCANCNSHLGHVFDDGPAPTGLRYCINGLALSFKAAEKSS